MLRPGNHLIHVRAERDHGLLPVRHIDAPELAVVRDDNGFAVRRERKRRHQIPTVPRFLIVALHVWREPAFVARSELAQAQRGE